MKFHQELNREFFAKRRSFWVEFICATSVSVFSVTQAWFLANALNSIFFDAEKNFSHYLTLFLMFAIARASTQWIRERNTNRLANSVSSSFRNQIAQHVLNLKAHLPHHFSPAILSELHDAKTNSIEPYFRSFIPALISASTTTTVIFIFVLTKDPLSSIVLLITAPLIPFFAALIGSAAANSAQKQWLHLERLAKHFSDLLRGWETLRIFHAQEKASEQILLAGENYRHSTLKILKIAFLSAFSLEFIATISTAILAVEIGLRLVNGKMEFLPAMTILILAPEFYIPLRNLGSAFHASVSGIEAMNDIRLFLDIPVPGVVSELPSELPSELHNTTPMQTIAFPSNWKTLCLQKASTRYPTSQSDVLKGISITIHKGDRIALIGPSGIGKSTFCLLLARHLPLYSGTILLDTRNSTSITNHAWHEEFVTIPQHPVLAATTLRENILLGRTAISEQQIAEACANAGLTAVLSKLSAGIDTLVGEHGITLSTGQAHRVALARTFLTPSQFLILDEPTAHLDSETEAIVHKGIEQLAASRTLIIITHRQSTLSLCNRVFCFSQNGISEQNPMENIP